jgi:hypothetical protein
MDLPPIFQTHICGSRPELPQPQVAQQKSPGSLGHVEATRGRAPTERSV